MGWSCAAKAAYVLDAIREIYGTEISNGLPNKGWFWETGRENADGAITGTVWKPWKVDPKKVVRAGSFKIDPDGKIVRFPSITKKTREEVERMASQMYRERFERGFDSGPWLVSPSK